MNRRDFLGLAAAGQPLRFLNRKAGLHPFQTREVGQRPHVFLLTLDMVSPDHYHPSRAMHREIHLPHRAVSDVQMVRPI